MSHTRNRITAVAVLALAALAPARAQTALGGVLALLAAACGDDENAATTAAPTTTAAAPVTTTEAPSATVDKRVTARAEARRTDLNIATPSIE